MHHDGVDIVIGYEARVRFRIWVWVQVWDSAIFEKVGWGGDRVRRLKNY